MRALCEDVCGWCEVFCEGVVMCVGGVRCSVRVL